MVAFVVVVALCINRPSADEVTTKLSLFERRFKMKKGGVFSFAISSFIPKLFKFLYYANETLMTS